jgi:hypothetical protein
VIKLNPGCYIRTMDHVITADETKEVKVHSKWFNWTRTLGELFQQWENEIITTSIKSLQTQISRKFDADELLHKLDTLTKSAILEH